MVTPSFLAILIVLHASSFFFFGPPQVEAAGEG
jgi:hypothetical protein